MDSPLVISTNIKELQALISQFVDAYDKLQTLAEQINSFEIVATVKPE